MREIYSRRYFVKQLGGGLAFPFVARSSWAKASPNEVVRHASFGGGGMAGSDLGNISSHKNVMIAAVAEIDPNRRNQAKQRFKTAKV